MIYYVKPNGSGDCCSINSAGEFLNIVNSLQPGDILYMLSGIYNYNSQITINISGNLENKILIKAYDDNDLPIFDFRNQPYGDKTNQNCNGFRLFGEYIHINGIVIRYAGFKGIRSELSNSILENIEIYGCCDSGIHLCSGGNNTIINCVSHDNFGYKTMNGEKIKFGYDSDGISDKLHYGKPNTFINCKSYNNTDDGFDFFGRCTEDFTKVNNCISYDNGKKIFNMNNYPRYNIDKEWFDQFINGKEMIDINDTSVFITLDNYPAYGNGNGFKLSGKRRYHCIELNNCKAINNSMKGFDQNHNSGIMKLNKCHAENNKVYDYGFSENYCGNAVFNECTSKANNNDIKCANYEIIKCIWKMEE